MAFLNEIEGEIVDELRSGPKTTRQISDSLEKNWATVDKYLRYLEGFGRVKSESDTRKRYYLKQKENFFDLPLTKDQEEKINKIYQIIADTAKVTKTQAQKILFRVNKELNLNLPIGWYQFGPITVKPYEDKVYESNHKFSNKDISKIKEITTKYSKLDNFDLENKVYKEENNELYKKRKELISMSFEENKDRINMNLMDFLKLVPIEVKDLTEDFLRATLLLGWNAKTREIFDDLWKFVAKINFKNSISKHYDYNIDSYFNLQDKEDIHLSIKNLVVSYADAKYSQDALYQKFVKHKK